MLSKLLDLSDNIKVMIVEISSLPMLYCQNILGGQAKKVSFAMNHKSGCLTVITVFSVGIESGFR